MPTVLKNTDKLAKKVAEKSKGASVLQAELDAKIKEVDVLQKENEDLEAENRKLKRQQSENEVAMEEFESTGRRFFFR